MEKLNMAKVNTLFKKGYLLAGVMMAANMFVVNEVKAMNTTKIEGENINKEGQGMEDQFQNSTNLMKEEIDVTIKKADDLNNKKNKKGHKKKQSPLDKLLSRENYFNFFGTLALSSANSYFKWWDYNAGSYCKLRIGCLGWRTKKFFDTVQLDFNLNLGRGAFWAIPHIVKFRRSLTKTGKTELEDSKESIKENEEENVGKGGSNASLWVSFLFKDILRGFVSAPLTFHISKFNFSISISLDSILWEFVIGRFFNTDEKGGKKNESELNSQTLINEKN